VHDIAFVHFPDLISGLVSKYYRYFTPRFLAKAKKIVSVSAFVKQDIINYYKIPSEKIAITYNACQNIYQTISIENQQLIKEKYSKGKNYIFFVGAVHPRKNVHRLIEAFDVFKSKTNSDFKLLIAGRFAWQTGEVKNAFDKAKHKEDICFLGFVAENELSLLMASAFALVWVSLFEGFGIPLLEAMQCDVPIITSNSTAMPEVVGEAGITVEPTDIQAIANAMQVIFEDEALKQKLIEKGRIQREKFNWNISSAVVYDLLKEIASK
jgi:glycosyltransferase involved in cell wall biosynthesis